MKKINHKTTIQELDKDKTYLLNVCVGDMPKEHVLEYLKRIKESMDKEGFKTIIASSSYDDNTITATPVSDLYAKLACALTHDMEVCGSCKKCSGKDFAEIRVNLLKELAEYMTKNINYDTKD